MNCISTTKWLTVSLSSRLWWYTLSLRSKGQHTRWVSIIYMVILLLKYTVSTKFIAISSCLDVSLWTTSIWPWEVDDLSDIPSETEREMVSKESFFEDEEVWLKANFLSITVYYQQHGYRRTAEERQGSESRQRKRLSKTILELHYSHYTKFVIRFITESSQS